MEYRRLTDTKGELRGNITITQFTVFICSDSPPLLFKEVDEFEKLGWRLLGPIAVIPNPNNNGESEGLLSATLACKEEFAPINIDGGDTTG